MQSSPSTETVAMLLFSVAFLSAGAMAEVELGLDVEAAVVLLISPAVLLRSIRLKGKSTHAIQPQHYQIHEAGSPSPLCSRAPMTSRNSGVMLKKGKQIVSERAG